MKTIEGHGVLTVMDFPPHSPEIIPTEHLKWHLETEKTKHSITLQEAFWDMVELCLDNMSQQILHQTSGVSITSSATLFAKAKRGTYLKDPTSHSNCIADIIISNEK